MPTLEERVQALEQENVARKKAEELLTVAVHALVSKEAFEKLQETVEKSQEQNSKLFDVLNTHNVITNERLADLQGQIIELDGKVVGLQTEMRQRFAEQDGKIVGLQTEVRRLDSKVSQLDSKVMGLQAEMHQRFAEQDSKITGLQTTQTEHTALLQQILARLPEKS